MVELVSQPVKKQKLQEPKTIQEIANIKSVLEVSLATLKNYDLLDDIKRVEGAIIILDYVLGNKEAEQCEACLLKTTVETSKALKPQ